MPFFQKGDIRIRYEEAGSGFPLLVIPGGGLNSTVAGSATHPFNPFDEFKGEFRVIAADLRNAKGGQSSGPFEVDRPWGAYTDDHIGLMEDRKSTRLNSSHVEISYAVFCLKKKKISAIDEMPMIGTLCIRQ